MRRMPDWARPAIVFSCGVLFLVLGVRYYQSNQKRIPASELSREIASAPTPVEEPKVEKKPVHPVHEDDSDIDEHPMPKAKSPTGPELQGTIGGLCSSLEYDGPGFSDREVSNSDWEKVLKEFHHAKKITREWLKTHQMRLLGNAYEIMDKQIESLQIFKPVAFDEPDLSWRGIAVLGRDRAGKNSVRITKGFVTLVLKQPKRGLFELTRVMAQAIAPCELERLGVSSDGSPWRSLLGCLQLNDYLGCGVGQNSESGWAASSSLAFYLAPPDCRLPVFASPEKAKCVTLLKASEAVSSGAHQAAPKKSEHLNTHATDEPKSSIPSHTEKSHSEKVHNEKH